MSQTWNEGYFTDISYTCGYYREINPVFLDFCLLLRGYEPAGFGHASTHCELGYGQGLSANIHAAANPGNYFGTDFTPSHAAFAQSLATRASNGAMLFDDSFEEFLARDDLPQFDSISLHGIWAWVSDQNRTAITAFARRHLRPGGVFYVSYNCFPGWAPLHPLRQLFTLHDRYASPPADTHTRVDAALKFAGDLFAADARALVTHPHLGTRLQGLKEQNRQYLAHEYFNREWSCMYFADVAEELTAAKLEFACSAIPKDAIDLINLSATAQEHLRNIGHPILREQTRDYFTDQHFRKDIYARGLRRLSASEQRERLFDMRFVLTQPVNDIPKTITGAFGSVGLEQYQPVIDAFAANNYSAKSLRQLLPLVAEVPWGVLHEMLAALCSEGSLAPCHPEALEQEMRPRCRALNHQICLRACHSSEITFLASPLTGGGTPVSRTSQLFLLARENGKSHPADWAAFAWSVLLQQGECMVKDGRALTTGEENVAELKSIADKFNSELLPVLISLGVA